jgi:hypothetical protein
MKSIFTFLFVALCGFLILNSCKSVTEAEDSYKNPNDMTWTCDTLYFADEVQTSLNEFSALDINNIYAYGWSSCLWHYNGSKWSRIDIINTLGTFNATKMLEFASSNIFCFGYSSYTKSKILRYTGLVWSEYTISGQVEARLLTACANKSTNMYAAGDNGWILYFNGTTWLKDQIKMYVPSGSQYLIRSSAIYNDTTYFTAFKTDFAGRDVHYIIKGTYKNWVVSDSMVIDNISSQYKWGWWSLYVTPGNKLMSYGDAGVWEYKTSGWEHKLTTENSVRGIFALNENYIISTGALNEVYFYDGAGWKKLTQFNNDTENIIYKAAWGDGKELFIMGNTTGSFPQKTIIWHGK